ncbi:MAG: deoxyribose-phosphate aldolase [Candidatus Hydrothermota bacterium]|nr:MAG: deoxyribose-phosphate aldolase [Candidatus Hydrothermae bacterium]
MLSVEELAKRIDHTLLRPDAQLREIENLAEEAVRYGFRSVCVNPSFVPVVDRILNGTNVMVCTVVGFPLGATSTEVKAYEAKWAVENGAQEIDMVIHIGKLKEGDDGYVVRDIRAVVTAAQNAKVKVIIETAFLTDEEKLRAVELIKHGGAHFVKTSTGFASTGAKLEDVRLLASKAKPLGLKVKAAGGIRDFKTAVAMIEAGADVIGASRSVQIIRSASSEVKK